MLMMIWWCSQSAIQAFFFFFFVIFCYNNYNNKYKYKRYIPSLPIWQYSPRHSAVCISFPLHWALMPPGMRRPVLPMLPLVRLPTIPLLDRPPTLIPRPASSSSTRMELLLLLVVVRHFRRLICMHSAEHELHSLQADQRPAVKMTITTTITTINLKNAKKQ